MSPAPKRTVVEKNHTTEAEDGLAGRQIERANQGTGSGCRREESDGGRSAVENLRGKDRHEKGVWRAHETHEGEKQEDRADRGETKGIPKALRKFAAY
jgi:hypothetical protein